VIERWACGHIAGSMCQECYNQLALRSHVLAEQVIELGEENASLRQERDEAWAKIDQLLGRTP
jgi:hypothetical protein